MYNKSMISINNFNFLIDKSKNVKIINVESLNNKQPQKLKVMNKTQKIVLENSHCSLIKNCEFNNVKHLEYIYEGAVLEEASVNLREFNKMLL